MSCHVFIRKLYVYNRCLPRFVRIPILYVMDVCHGLSGYWIFNRCLLRLSGCWMFYRCLPRFVRILDVYYRYLPRFVRILDIQWMSAKVCQDIGYSMDVCHGLSGYWIFNGCLPRLIRILDMLYCRCL